MGVQSALDWNLRALKASFFDTKKIQKELDTFERKALSKLGAYIRRRAKSSIKNAPKIDVATGQITRKRKGLALRDAVSAPGKPPYSHEGSLKRLILFAYDARGKSLVVGPAKFKVGDVPRTLEHGGSVTVRTPVPRIRSKRRAKPQQAAAYRRLVLAGRIVVPPTQYDTRLVTIKARPAMKPAGDEEVKRFPQTLRSMAK